MGKGALVAVASTAAAVLGAVAAAVLARRKRPARRPRLSSASGRMDSIRWYQQQPTYTLTNQLGMEVTVSCIGASITKVRVLGNGEGVSTQKLESSLNVGGLLSPLCRAGWVAAGLVAHANGVVLLACTRMCSSRLEFLGQ